jgi:AcrR family transcriptional regulator
VQALTISQLERATGVGRNTIYYYIGEGLLPPGQKASATRAIYDQTHVDLLEEIGRLKEQGLSLGEIRGRLQPTLAAAGSDGVDLVARQNEETRNAILEAAAHRFARQGYESTRVADVCKDAGVTAQVFYGHFPSKRHLFIECYQVYYRWMYDQVEPAIDATDDLNARLAWRSWAGLGIQAFSPDLQALARVEAFHSESELRPLVRGLYEKILTSTQEELASERTPGANPALFDDELVSYAFVGALESMQMRASWDARYTRRDVMRTLLTMYMAVRAAYRGQVDLTREWAAVAQLVDDLAASSPRASDAVRAATPPAPGGSPAHGRPLPG